MTCYNYIHVFNACMMYAETTIIFTDLRPQSFLDIFPADSVEVPLAQLIHDFIPKSG